MKRELIESCPDLPEHLDLEEDCHLDQQEYPRLEDLGCEKEDVAKEEIKKILSKVDERKKRGRKPVRKNTKNEDEDEDDEWNVDDCKDLEADAYSGRKKSDKRRSSNIFPCPHTVCGATFTKEVFQKPLQSK